MTPRRPRRSVAAVAIATVSILLSPAIVSAHAELATMTPADASRGPAPTEIVATFTEDVSPAGTSLAIVDATGSVVAKGGTVDAADTKTFRLAISNLPPGAYTVRWTSKSAADGDLDRGTTAFTVTASSASPASSALASAEPSDAPSPSTSVAPSAANTPSPAPSGGAGSPAASTTDALIPIVVVLAAVLVLGLWLLRGRRRAR